MYILECRDGSYYVGCTNNLQLRILQHNDGYGCSYTAIRRPVKLIYYEAFHSILDAYNREQQIKGWSRAKKKALIEGDDSLLSNLSKAYRDLK